MSLSSASAASADASDRGVMSKDSKNKGGRPYGSRAAAAAASLSSTECQTSNGFVPSSLWLQANKTDDLGGVRP